MTEGKKADPADEKAADELRREFIKRFGAYAAGSAVGLTVLLSGKGGKAQPVPEGGDSAP